ncbi:MAG TPA: hypothetical protein VIO11_06770 [Candidatus Methanoperedens sp.]
MKKNLDTTKIDVEDLYNSQEEYQQIQTEFCGLIQQLTPGLYSQGQELLDRISTRNWALEWGLPRWLGEAYNLPESTIHELILANIFMLGFVRIIDDVIDDDFQPSYSAIEGISTPTHQLSFSANNKHNHAILLGTLLQNLWYKHHVRLLSQTEAKISARQSCDNGLVPSYLDAATQSLSEWINVTSDQERRPTHGFSAFTETDYLRIGHRGSVLKTCCIAACLVAGRDTEIQPLTIAIDHILIGVGMKDDILDWLSDLQAGRYNVFIAFCSDLAQTAEFRSANELAVLRAIYIDQKIDSFFDLILEHIFTAEKAAMLATSPKFCKFISCLRSDICTHKSELNMITLAQIREASDRFLTNSLGV